MKTLALTIALLIIANFAIAQGAQIGGFLKVESGAVLTVNGNLKIDEGSLTLDAGSVLVIGDTKTLSVLDGGIIRLTGENGTQAVVTSPGYFYFHIHSGGSIAAGHARFERMAEQGLFIHEGAFIDTEHPLHNCVFQDGSIGSTLLTIDNDQILTINGVEFNHTPGIELHNVAKYNDEGKITFTNFTGNFGGEEHELDPNSRIHWIAVIPYDLALENLVIPGGQDTCFDALQTITLAGGGTTFVVESGGFAELIAGGKVMLLYGTFVESGGKFHAWITEDASFCQNEKSLLNMKTEVAPGIWPDKAIEQNNRLFSIYPNPATAFVLLEFHGNDHIADAEIELFGFLGECLQKTKLSGGNVYRIELSHLPKGIYLIRVVRGYETGIRKIIKQ